MTLRHITLALAIGAGIIGAGAAGAQTTHDYEFTSGLNDSVTGGAPLAYSTRDNITGTGTVSGGSYNFAAGQGLVLSSQLPGSTYTIDISASFATVDGYRKLVSFNDITLDSGLYIDNGYLVLYNVTSPSATAATVAANTPFDVRLSRDGTTGIITGYLNGALQFTYDDAVSDTTFTASSNLWFLRDDDDQKREDSVGSADYIRIAASATGAPPATTPPSVPEPATWAMAMLGFGMVGTALRRRPAAALPARAVA